MRSVLAIAGVSLRRFLRDRSNYFFVFVFPMLLVVLVGLQFGDSGGGGRVVVTGASPLADRVASALQDEGLDVARGEALEEARTSVARGRAAAAVLVNDDDHADFEAGEPVDLAVVAGSQAGGMAAQQVVAAAVADLSNERAAVTALVERDLPRAQAEQALATATDRGPTLVTSVAGEEGLATQFAGLGQFDLGAAQQLSLFVFLASLAGAAMLIQSRQLGVTRRELAAPVTTGQVVAGEGLGRFAIALTQGVYIVAGTALLFGVDWGDPLATGLVLLAFCAVSAAAAMVMGAMLDNANVANGVGVGAGLVFAALGGSMMPLELFPDSLMAAAAVTPHRWAYEAYAEITRRGGTVVDVLPQLGVLVLMTAVLLPVGAWLLRRSLQRAM